MRAATSNEAKIRQMPQAPSAVIAAQSSAAAGARGRKPPLSASPSPLISPPVRGDRDFTTMTTTTMSGAGWANKFSVDGAERCARAADAVRRSRYALSLSPLSPSSAPRQRRTYISSLTAPLRFSSVSTDVIPSSSPDLDLDRRQWHLVTSSCCGLLLFLYPSVLNYFLFSPL